MTRGATAHAQTRVVTRCTAPEGQSLFVKGGLVGDNATGWQKGGISKGSFLVMKHADDYDIIYVDAANRTVSTREDGGQVLEVKNLEGTLMLLAVYADNVGLWTFRIDEDGRGFVILGQSRFDSRIAEKYSLMKASCLR